MSDGLSWKSVILGVLIAGAVAGVNLLVVQVYLKREAAEARAAATRAAADKPTPPTGGPTSPSASRRSVRPRSPASSLGAIQADPALEHAPAPPPGEDDEADECAMALTPERIETILNGANRRADYLLAAAILSGEADARVKYLREAASANSADPMIQASIVGYWLMLGSTDDRVLGWIEAFKQHDPDNMLGYCYAAYYQMKTGNTEAAVHELDAAAARGVFADYVIERWDLLSRFAQDAGWPETAAMAQGLGVVELPYGGIVRELARNLTAEAKRYADAGDVAAGLELCAQLRQVGQTLVNSGSGVLINELVGMSVETTALDTERTLAQAANDVARVAEVDRRKAELQERRTYIAALAGAMAPALDRMQPADLLQFYARIRQDGEAAAIQSLPEAQALLRSPQPPGK